MYYNACIFCKANFVQLSFILIVENILFDVSEGQSLIL
jgi:hypothetical protein